LIDLASTNCELVVHYLRLNCVKSIRRDVQADRITRTWQAWVVGRYYDPLWLQADKGWVDAASINCQIVWSICAAGGRHKGHSRVWDHERWYSTIRDLVCVWGCSWRDHTHLGYSAGVDRQGKVL